MAGVDMRAVRAEGFMLRLACFYGAMFLVTGAKVTYLPVWLDWRGLTSGEIGLILAAPLFLRIAATPLIAVAADLHGDHRRAIVLLAWASLLLLLLLSAARGLWPILALTLLLSVASTSLMPLTETIAMRGVRRAGHDYGRMRLWGSLTFIAASFAAGAGVERLGAGSVIWMLAAGAALTALGAHALPRPARASSNEPDPPRPKLNPLDVARLLSSLPFAVFLAAVGAVQAAHAVFYAFGVLHWRTQGVSAAMVGVLWAVGVVAEIALFACSGAVVRRVGAAGLVLAGAAASIVRWAAMAFDPPLAGLLALQALHGLTYGATHLGAMHLMSATVPEAQGASAQALYASVAYGIASGAATLLAGGLYPELGGKAYLAMAALSGVGLLASLALLRLAPRRG